MKNVEIFNGNWTLSDIKSHPKKIFVFGDNNLRYGKGGQAIIRDLPNTIGLRTKKAPNNQLSSFYSDSDLEENKKNIIEDILTIKDLQLKGNIIVFSNGGYGTGLSKLKEHAPKTFEYLCDCLKSFFNYDNETGNKYYKIPSNDDIVSGIYVNLSAKDILQPESNSSFKEDFLFNDIYNTYDAIKLEKKISFTSLFLYKKDDILIFSHSGKKDYLVCKVTHDSLPINNLEQWSNFEGFNSDFIKVDISDYLQTTFEFICSLSDKGFMTFNSDIFGTVNEVKETTNTIGDPMIVEYKEEEKEVDVNKRLDDMDKKLDFLMDFIKSQISKN
jgi:hypothetical protein